MKTEQELKVKYTEKLRGKGVWIKSIETSVPGFPDSILSRYGSLKLIEFKRILKKDLGSPMIDLFTRYQVPFYLDYLKHTGAHLLLVCFYDGREYIYRIDLELIHLIRTSSAGDFLTIADLQPPF